MVSERDEPHKEMYGLGVIISEAVENGTLHVIAEPPKREDYATEEEFQHAYWRSVSWVGTITNIGDENG